MARAASPPFRPTLPPQGRGRGARSNQTGRYEKDVREQIDDGWTDEMPPDPRTTVQLDPVRRIITYNESPYVGFDRSINPYRGCEHGCIYCFARPTHAYLGLSPGLDFETRLFARPGAADHLRRELSAARYKIAPIAIGTNTDPYQPVERKFRVMRSVLEVLSAFNHPVSVLTKSDLIMRDIDVLSGMAQRGLARAMVSVTTLDRRLARAMEPRCPRPDRRLLAIKALSEAGIPTGIMLGPMIPGLSDHELDALMEEGRAHGAVYAAYTILRLPQEVAPLFQEWLEAFAPNHARKVMNHIREMNDGKIYDVNWSRAEGPRGAYAHLLKQRFDAAWRRHGYREMPRLRTDRFAVPRAPSDQGDLFG
ncbi:PA0069 family radical SAM protein [Parvularcula sp. LCG005]|uniref:PA0069 family radical SAM protein n=1 Tax=Parvularcula sp. LCG005 TaxID=3078805 RepID=UPI0029430DC0|nr:PA0069 family radical SAM protein [Parvularcula sp. LCG005]WOI53756.1 PA0069 family radical SAM protein [Parvularcula sp. LCG005]